MLKSTNNWKAPIIIHAWSPTKITYTMIPAPMNQYLQIPPSVPGKEDVLSRGLRKPKMIPLSKKKKKKLTLWWPKVEFGLNMWKEDVESIIKKKKKTPPKATLGRAELLPLPWRRSDRGAQGNYILLQRFFGSFGEPSISGALAILPY